VSAFPTTFPSTNEIESCKWITLTSNEEWIPENDVFFHISMAVSQNSMIPLIRIFHLPLKYLP
jgi:hypothetical protein